MKRIILLAATAVLLALTLAGCSDEVSILGERYLRYEGAEGDNEAAYTYRVLTGTDSWEFEAEAGSTLKLVYDAVVSRGTLTFSLRAPDGTVIWLKTLDRDEGDTADGLALDQTGTYTVGVQGINTRGEFALAWEITP